MTCMSSISMEIFHPRGKEHGVHRRMIRFDKETGEVLIQDSVADYRGKVLVSLPMVMNQAQIVGNTVHCIGCYGVKADVEFESGPEEIFQERGRSTPMFPNGGDSPMLLYIRAVFDASQKIKTRIRPM